MSVIRFSSFNDLEQQLSRGTDEDAAHPEVRWLLTPEQWFELPRAARLGAERSVRIEATIRDAEGSVPLDRLCLTDFIAVYEVLREWRQLLAGESRPPSLDPAGYERLLGDVRATLLGRSDRELDRGGSTPAGEAVAFGVPPLDHPLNNDPEEAIGFWKVLLWTEDSPSVHRAARDLAERDDPVSVCAARPWLRVLLQRVILERWNPAVRKFLLAIYDDARRREAWLREEREAMAPVGLADLADSLARELGLDQSLRRARPFAIPKTGRIAANEACEAAPAEPDVTVLIPSYRHEDYVEETLRSVCAQTHRAIAIRVVDDRSPDATVARARSVDDPRVSVQVNEQNLGLGNSVLQALDSIRTPFVALLNSDDMFHPQRIEKCLDALQANPSSQLVATGLALIDANGKRLTHRNVSRILDSRNVRDWVLWYDRVRPRSVRPGTLFGELLERNFLATSSNLVCRTEFLRDRGDALRSLKFCLDWQLFLDAAREDALVHVPDELLAYRLHERNTVWFRKDERWAYSLEVNRVAAQAVRDHVAALPPDSDERVERALRDLAEHLVANTETDSIGLYLNELIGGLVLERASSGSAAVRKLLASLESLVNTPQPNGRDGGGERSQVLASKGLVYRDELASLHTTETWLRQRVEDQDRSLAEGRQRIHELLADCEAVRAERDRTKDERERLRAELAAETEALRTREQELAAETEARRAREQELAAEEQRHGDTARELARETAAREATQQALYEARARHRIDVTARERRAQWHRAARLFHRQLKWRRKLGMLWVRMRLRAARVFGWRRPMVVVGSGLRAKSGHERAIGEITAAAEEVGVETGLLRWIEAPAPVDLPAVGIGVGRRVLVFSYPEHHDRDRRYWQRRAPERVVALVESMASRTGTGADEAMRTLLPGLSFARMAGAWRPGYLHAPGFDAGAMRVRIAAALLGCRWGIAVDTLDVGDDPALTWLRSELGTADLILARSSTLRDAVVELSGVAVDSTHVVIRPGPVRGEDTPAADATDGDALQIVSTGPVTPAAGWTHLLKAAAAWRARGGRFRVHLVGEPDLEELGSVTYEERVRGTSHTLGLVDRVEFHEQPGFDSLPALAKAGPAVFAVPVVDESDAPRAVPAGLLAAMAAGLPIVASDARCLQEVLHDGRDAIVVRQGDEAALADALARLAASRALRQELGAAARARFAEHLDAGHTDGELQARLRTILESQR